MYADTVQKFAETGAAKARWFSQNPLGFMIAAAMAGIYVGFGILLIFSLGSALDPAVRPLVMGASFGLALILVVFAGSELYTGYTMMMTIATLEGRTTPRQLLTLWVATWAGNMVGAIILAALFVLGGGGLIMAKSANGFIDTVAAAKMNADVVPLVCRAILCNWLVCLALWVAARCTSDSARMIAIAWCLFAFVASGYEHSIANMTIFAVALMAPYPDTVTLGGAAWNLLWVTIGNTIAGAGLMGVAYWVASKPANAGTVLLAQPAE